MKPANSYKGVLISLAVFDGSTRTRRVPVGARENSAARSPRARRRPNYGAAHTTHAPTATSRLQGAKRESMGAAARWRIRGADRGQASETAGVESAGHRSTGSRHGSAAARRP